MNLKKLIGKTELTNLLYPTRRSLCNKFHHRFAIDL